MSRQDLAIEQKVLRGLKLLPRPPRRLLLAVSGGADSMVMAEILGKWRVGLRLELAIAHVHHGLSENPEQNAFRKAAQNLVAQWAREHDVAFFTNRPVRSSLKSEDDLRDFREGKLALWSARFKADAMAFAHHRDDLLETRLIRLIRGSGTQGLTSMCLFRRGKLRPLLALSAREIRAYAQLKKLKWMEDPSNLNHDVLRNWLRQNWLPSLEGQRPGALKALARSLEMIAPRPKEFDLAPYVGLRRDFFTGKSLPMRRELLARYLHSLGLKGYAQTHVDEILKRVDTRRKNLHFEMLGMRFNVSTDFLWASRV